MNKAAPKPTTLEEARRLEREAEAAYFTPGSGPRAAGLKSAWLKRVREREALEAKEGEAK